jgi:LysM repeat protein
MTRWKRLFYYLIINIAVSACTTLVVLTVWERTHPFLADNGSLAARSQPSATIPPILATFQAGTETPVPSPTQPLTTYLVKSGDTLGGIALEFGVSVDEIMRLNGLEDANALGVGMVLFVPVVPAETPEDPGASATPAEPAATPNPDEPAQTPISSPAAAEPRVVIVNVLGAGDLPTERVRLERRGEGDLLLANWQIQDEDGHAYTFPQLALYPGGAIDLYTAAGVDDVVALYWGLEEPVWVTGEIVTLVDEQGNIQATYTVP